MEELQNQNNNITSSLDLSGGLKYDIKDENRHMMLMYKKIEELEQKLKDIETKKIVDETQLSPELLDKHDLLPTLPSKFKRGKGYRPILKSEVEEAMKHSKFCMAQARWLGVDYVTYKKYAVLYGLWQPHPNEKGKRNIFNPQKGKYHLDKILKGEYRDNPAVYDYMVKDKLIRSGILPAKCNICGYDKRRITDDKICLLLDHMDGDLRNYKLENLQLLCLNCTYECGRGYIRRGNHTFDVDWMQGAESRYTYKPNRW